MKEHLVFFAEECPVCQKWVQHILEIDKNHHIKFASFTGQTAAQILTGPLKQYTQINSLVLLENYQSTERKFWIRSRSLMRIYWLVGNGWGLFGWLSFLPSFLSDRIYRKLGHHRHQFKLKMKESASCAKRFLP